MENNTRNLKWALSLAAMLLLPIANLRAEGTAPRIQNHASAFLRYWKEHKDRQPAEQVAGFKAIVAADFSEFYNYTFDRWKEMGRDPDEALKAQLAAFPAIAEAFEKKNRVIEEELAENLRTFQATFSDFNTDFDIHIVHSLGQMDGGGRQINGKTVFLFGVDGIVNYHKGMATEMPFYHHEFFHMYHFQHFKGEERIWAALWAEGLATYVSGELNPDASFQDVVLDLPEGLIEKCEADLPYLWATLAEKIDSNSEDDYAAFFLFSKHPRIPSRAGYYLGYHVVKELRQGRSLQELARLDGRALREEIVGAIGRLARK